MTTSEAHGSTAIGHGLAAADGALRPYATTLPADDAERLGPDGHPLLPGGYGRSTFAVGDAASPLAVRGEGWRLWDDQGRELIDLNNNFAALIHGHAHPEIVAAAH